jgi:hypothetical protein
MASHHHDDAPGWRELWTIEMRDRRWLWLGNLLLACAAAGQWLGSLA